MTNRMPPQVGIIIPLANEAKGLKALAEALRRNLDKLQTGEVYFVIDRASKDETHEICSELASADARFNVLWAPENRNVVDAYLHGYRHISAMYDYIIEMDAGFSHDPDALPVFIDKLQQGYEVVYGSRFMKEGKMTNAPMIRKVLSKAGTIISNLMLDMHMKDMTSGYIAMTSELAQKIARHNFRSTGHFYQTELRCLLKEARTLEIPIHYSSPSSGMGWRSVKNAIEVLLYYFYSRMMRKK